MYYHVLASCMNSKAFILACQKLCMTNDNVVLFVYSDFSCLPLTEF